MKRKLNYVCALGLSIIMIGTTVFAAAIPESTENFENIGTTMENLESIAIPENIVVPENTEVPESSEVPESGEAESTEIPESVEIQESIVIPKSVEALESTAVPESTETQESIATSESVETLSLNAESGLAGFVTRLYEIALQRSPRQDEIQFWVDRLRNGAASGAEVAAGFFNSDEYKRRGKSNETYVKELYQAIMGRQPDQGGYQDWVSRLDDGVSRPNILSGFLNSEEFGRLCNSYGVSRGNYHYSESRDRNSQATAFVQRLYRIVMGRAGDEGGLNSWTTVLLDQGGNGANVAYGFFFSDEYKNKNNSDDAYITDLYRAILNREPDAGGKAFWLERLSNGMSRYGIFAGVVNSVEFGSLCEKYGISRGSYISPEYRDQNGDVTAFVQRLYRNVFGRAGDVGGLNNWANFLNNGGTGTEIAAAFILSDEYKNKTVTLSDYVEMLYQTLLNRNSDAGGKADWIKQVRNGRLIPADLIQSFTGSEEFGRLCAKYGIQTGAGIRVTGDFPNMVIYEPELVPEMLELVNQARVEAGLDKLVTSERLDKIALQRVQEISRNFSHDGAVTAENIASSSSVSATASRMFNGWMNSKGHKDNILTRGYKAMGCAKYIVNGKSYWVQVFSSRP